MDGTGDLFADFIAALPKQISPVVVRYPSNQSLSYSQLLNLVQSSLPPTDPFVLLAESFSTPVAIQSAAKNPPNLLGLILCAGFASSPAHGWRRFIGSSLASLAFRLPLPRFVASRMLLGLDPPRPLLALVRDAVRSVKPEVLSERLRAVLACDVRTELAQVTTPVLYLQASQDRLVPQSCLEEIKRIIPHIKIATIAGAHLLLQREPQLAAEAIAKFFQMVTSEA
jgi:pimeloyl-[acyl-carrier protein] methyl ester esterase